MNSATIASITALAIASPVSASFTYHHFPDASGLMLNGNAAIASGALHLTHADLASGGSVFTTNEINLGTSNSFSCLFQFRITGSGGLGDEDGDGADGLVFVMQTVNNTAGSLGGGLGYAGISPSLGIEFDTYHNSGDDPNGNHVGINLNGNTVSIATAPEAIRFNNGSFWNVWVDFDGPSGQLEVRWSLGSSRPVNPMLSSVVDLAATFGKNATFVGFTSATGSGYGRHELHYWSFVDSHSPLGDAPQAPLPSLSIDPAIVLKFESVVGQLYTIEKSTDLVSWLDEIVGIEGDGSVKKFYFEQTIPRAFYRLKP